MINFLALVFCALIVPALGQSTAQQVERAAWKADQASRRADAPGAWSKGDVVQFIQSAASTVDQLNQAEHLTQLTQLKQDLDKLLQAENNGNLIGIHQEANIVEQDAETLMHKAEQLGATRPTPAL